MSSSCLIKLHLCSPLFTNMAVKLREISAFLSGKDICRLAKNVLKVTELHQHPAIIILCCVLCTGSVQAALCYKQQCKQAEYSIFKYSQRRPRFCDEMRPLFTASFIVSYSLSYINSFALDISFVCFQMLARKEQDRSPKNL